MPSEPGRPLVLKALSQPFMRGKPSGQIQSLYSGRHTHPEKIKEFREALAQGLISLGASITRQEKRKLEEMDIAIPSDVEIRAPRTVRQRDIDD